MLDFKLCSRYKEAESKEHCPFDTVCNLNCYFSLENELSEVQDERDILENQKDELIKLIKYIITISNQEQLNKIKNEVTMLDYDWYDDIRDKINERIN